MQALKYLWQLLCLAVVAAAAPTQCWSLDAGQRQSARPQQFSDELLPNPAARELLREHQTRFPAVGPNEWTSDLRLNISTRTKETVGIECHEQGDCGEANFCYNLSRLAESGFNASARTVVLVPSFWAPPARVEFASEVREKWLRLEDVNVISVGTRSNQTTYEAAAGSAAFLARAIVTLLHYLAELNGRHLSDDAFVSRIHIVGFSEGAHAAGFVGQYLKRDGKARLGRITGLDPAGAHFDQSPVDGRLDKGDAQLVEVIHTNSRKMQEANKVLLSCRATKGCDLDMTREEHHKLLEDGPEYENRTNSGECFGTDLTVGHLDFWANDGGLQPGVFFYSVLALDHSRAYLIYADILAYELELRERGTSGLERPLYAFRAADFADFQFGHNIQRLCPALLDEKRYRSEEPLAGFNSLVVPMDFVSPVDEIRKRLRRDHGLDVDGEPAADAGKLFFKTMFSPFVNEHFILKFKLGGPLEWDSDECRLRIGYRAIYNSLYREFFFKQISLVNGTTDLVALPLVTPRTNDHPYEFQNDPESPLKGRAHVGFIPIHMILVLGTNSNFFDGVSLDTVKANGTFPVPTKFSVTTKRGSRCAISIERVEVVAVVDRPRTLVGFYHRMRNSRSLEFKTLDEWTERAPIHTRGYGGSRLIYDLNDFFDNKF